MINKIITEKWICKECKDISEAPEGTIIKFCNCCNFKMYKDNISFKLKNEK